MEHQIRDGMRARRSGSHQQLTRVRTKYGSNVEFLAPGQEGSGTDKRRAAALHKSDAPDKLPAKCSTKRVRPLRRAGRSEPDEANSQENARPGKKSQNAKPSAPRHRQSMPPTKAKRGFALGQVEADAKRGDRGPAAMPAPICVWGQRKSYSFMGRWQRLALTEGGASPPLAARPLHEPAAGPPPGEREGFRLLHPQHRHRRGLR